MSVTQISDLKANPKNPKKIITKALEGLKKSLEKFGDLSGVVYNQKTDRLVGGHQRVKIFVQANPEIIMLDQSNGYFEFKGYTDPQPFSLINNSTLISLNNLGSGLSTSAL